MIDDRELDEANETARRAWDTNADFPPVLFVRLRNP